MDAEVPAQTLEGSLIERAAKATGRSIRTLAANAGISDTRWRHIVKGWQPAPGGTRAVVRAPATTLARIALVLDLTAEQLEEVGRSDAVPELYRLYRAGMSTISSGSPDSDRSAAADEIEMIYASKSMTAQEKLTAIRMVLQLRAEVEAGAATPTTSPDPADHH